MGILQTIATELELISSDQYSANHTSTASLASNIQNRATISSSDFRSYLGLIILDGEISAEFSGITLSNNDGITYTDGDAVTTTDNVETVNSELSAFFKAVTSHYFSIQAGTTRYDTIYGSFISSLFEDIVTYYPNWFQSDATTYIDYFTSKYSASKITIAPIAGNANIIIQGGTLVGVDITATGTDEIKCVATSFIGSDFNAGEATHCSFYESSTIYDGTISYSQVVNSSITPGDADAIIWSYNYVKDIIIEKTGTGTIKDSDGTTVSAIAIRKYSL